MERIIASARTAAGSTFPVLVDLVVLGNAVLLGLEVELSGSYTTLFQVVRVAIVVFYIVEMAVQLLALLEKFFFGLGRIVDLAVVILAVIDVIVFNQAGRLWRMTMIRVHRFSRVTELAKQTSGLTELWLVLSGIGRAVRATIWLVLVVGCVLCMCAPLAEGLVDSDDTGLDASEYFGSVPSSVISLFQLATFDNWASSIVRPLIQTNTLASIVFFLFAVLAGYGLMSIAVGVFVWSTVELARSHQGHTQHSQNKDDEETIKMLKDTFGSLLVMSEKEAIDLPELRDAFKLQHVVKLVKILELPVADCNSLFSHLDKNKRGAVTLEEFEEGMHALKRPASRFDFACLNAKIGGGSTFVSRLDRRADRLRTDIQYVAELIGSAINELQGFAAKEMENNPDMAFRNAGMITKGELPKKTRYTEQGPWAQRY